MLLQSWRYSAVEYDRAVESIGAELGEGLLTSPEYVACFLHPPNNMYFILLVDFQCEKERVGINVYEVLEVTAF